MIRILLFIIGIIAISCRIRTISIRRSCLLRSTFMLAAAYILISNVITAFASYPVTISVKVFSDESEEAFADGNFSPDAKNIAPTTLRLRRERAGDRDGRVYLIVTTATDAAGNQAYSCATVKVPHSLNAASIASVNAQAAAAMAFCEANNGAAPPGFVEIGIGPVIGPKQ